MLKFINSLKFSTKARQIFKSALIGSLTLERLIKIDNRIEDNSCYKLVNNLCKEERVNEGFSNHYLKGK